jgi:hypothetical protein
MPWWQDGNICFSILWIFWNLGSQLSLHENVCHFIGTVPGRAVTLRWQVSVQRSISYRLRRMMVYSKRPGGITFDFRIVTLHPHGYQARADRPLCSLPCFVVFNAWLLSFKEQDSLNSRFRKFYSDLWPTIRRFGRGCTLGLSHLMPRSSCWLSCFVLGRSWYQISVGVASAVFHYYMWGSADGADSDCGRVSHGILLPSFWGNTPLPYSE